MRILASPAFSNAIVNPYNALLYSEMASHGIEVSEYSHAKSLFTHFSILHFHWPDGYINQKSLFKSLQRIVMFVLSILASKVKGCKIVWTMHNIEPHDVHHPKLTKTFMKWFAGNCDGFIFLSSESRNVFLKTFAILSQYPYAIIPHGHYRTSYPPAIDKAQAKLNLNISNDQNVLLCLGMIKPYKNVDQLINLFNEIRLDSWTLVIAGQSESNNLKNLLERLALGHPKIKLIFKFITNNEIANYMSAADAVILPYKNILNSGALLLALSFDKPVIAPLAGAVINLQADVGEEWIYSYSGDLTRMQLINFMTLLSTRELDTRCPLENYNWDSIGQKTAEFYNRLMSTTEKEKQVICH